jgi:hypothetical protein
MGRVLRNKPFALRGEDSGGELIRLVEARKERGKVVARVAARNLAA